MLKLPVIQCSFKEVKDGETRLISFYAKRARGMMARYAIDHRIDRPEGLKGFDVDGYRFQAPLSSATEWVFTRPQPDPVGVARGGN